MAVRITDSNAKALLGQKNSGLLLLIHGPDKENEGQFTTLTHAFRSATLRLSLFFRDSMRSCRTLTTYDSDLFFLTAIGRRHSDESVLSSWVSSTLDATNWPRSTYCPRR